MSAALLQTILLGVGIAGVAIAIEWWFARRNPAIRRGIPCLWAGGVLFIAALVMSIGWPNKPWIRTPYRYKDTRQFVQNTLGLYGGSLLVLFGLVWRVGNTSDQRHLAHLDAELKKKLHEASAAQGVLASVVRSSVSGVMILEVVRGAGNTVSDFVCRFMNKEAEQMLGRAAEEVIGQSVPDLLPCVRSEGLFDEAVNVAETSQPYWDERETTFRGRDMWYQVAVVKHGRNVITTFTDITNRKSTEQKLHRASRYDGLTDLPGRAALGERIVEAVTRAKRFPEYRYALLLLNLDRFQIVNESLGPEAGDRLLIAVAERLRDNVREIDLPARTGAEHMPVRLGGDEFGVLLDGIRDARSAMVVADRLQEALSKPFAIDGEQVTTSASIGIVVSHPGYEQPEELLRDALTAMKQAKNAGKARSVIFDEQMHKEVLERMALEKDLRRAVETLPFKLNYQPIVTLESLKLRGFEALIRWPHPERGMIRPDIFIGLAEELGLIVPIGEWVLREACGRLKAWRELRGGPVRMAVNLSKIQLDEPGLADTVRSVIAETGIDAGDLVLEVTESTVMDNVEALIPVLEELRATGAKLAMDDFGTGHSSLSLLHQIPIDILKVDRSFVMKSGEGGKYDAIVRTIVRLAHDLDMQVVAEGVETPDQVLMLQKLKTEYGQGYYFDKPLEADDAEKLVGPDHRYSVAA